MSVSLDGVSPNVWMLGSQTERNFSSVGFPVDLMNFHLLAPSSDGSKLAIIRAKEDKSQATQEESYVIEVSLSFISLDLCVWV